MKENPFNANPIAHESPDEFQSYGFFRWSSLLLAIGFLTLAIASALSQFVMIGLLGLLLFPVSLVTLLIGGAVVVGENQISWKRHVAGWATFFLGVLAVMFVSAITTTIAYDGIARSGSTLSTYQWGGATLGWVMSAVTIAALFYVESGLVSNPLFCLGSGRFGCAPCLIFVFLDSGLVRAGSGSVSNSS